MRGNTIKCCAFLCWCLIISFICQYLHLIQRLSLHEPWATCLFLVRVWPNEGLGKFSFALIRYATLNVYNGQDQSKPIYYVVFYQTLKHRPSWQIKFQREKKKTSLTNISLVQLTIVKMVLFLATARRKFAKMKNEIIILSDAISKQCGEK